MTTTPGDAAEFVVGEPLILIYISNELKRGLDVYDAVRRAWKIDINRVRNADGTYKLVLARDGKNVVGAYRPERWFVDRELPDRKAFSGLPAEQAVWRQYVGKVTPARFLPSGAQGPVRYFELGD